MNSISKFCDFWNVLFFSSKYQCQQINWNIKKILYRTKKFYKPVYKSVYCTNTINYHSKATIFQEIIWLT